MKNYLQSLFLVGVAMVSGCSNEVTAVSQFPALSHDLGKGPWQVITYEGNAVHKESVHIEDGQFRRRSEPVYVNNKSQFIFRDGKPIKDIKGNFLYWNDQGLIINKHLQVLREDITFSSNGRPLKIGTPLKIRGYGQPVNLASADDTITEHLPL